MKIISVLIIVFGIILIYLHPPLYKENDSFWRSRWFNPWKLKYNEKWERANTILLGSAMIILGIFGLFMDYK